MIGYVHWRELEREYRRVKFLGYLLLAVSLCWAVVTFAFGSEVQWSRFRGRVKGINAKTSTLTIQNGEGDLITVKVDQDVQLEHGKEQAKLTDLSIDDKVTMLYLPKAPVPKEDEPPPGGVYK
jgi:hypothetical protein